MRAPGGGLVLAGLLFLSSCASGERCEDRADFHVLAPSAELEGRVDRIMGDLLPQIAAAFGDPVGGTVFVAISPDCQSGQARRSAAISTSSGILVYDADPASLTGTLGHEIVHVVVSYRASFWNTLPVLLEEGLCCLVDHGLTGAREVVLDGYVPTSVVEHYLGFGFEDLQAQEGDDLHATYRVATYLAGLLGFDGLEALARRAHEEGHAVVPTEWALEAVERVERLRHLDPSVPPSSSLDPLFGRIEASVPREKTVRIRADFPGHEYETARAEGTR